MVVISAWKRSRAGIGRAGLAIADQALSSLTNFVVGIYVARSLGVGEFGAFSLAFATYVIALNASRGLATDPLVVRYSGVDVHDWRLAVAGSTGVAAAVGLAVGACCVVVGAILAGSIGAAFLALGITLPGLLVQDSWRYAFFSAQRGAQAVANDLVWAAALVPLLTIVGNAEPPRVELFVLAWGGAATLAAVVGAAQARLVPRLTGVIGWVVRHGDLGVRYLGENLSLGAAFQLRLYGLGLIAGVAAVGALRAAELLLGPVGVVVMGVGLMAVPEASRLLRQSLRRLRPFCLLVGGLQAGIAIVWGLAVLLLLPDWLGRRLLGASWVLAFELLLPVTLTMAGTGLWVGALTGLRALGAASRSLRAQLISSALFLAGAFGGAAVAGAVGAAWGSAAATLVAVVIWWRQLNQGLHEFRSS